MNQSVGRFVLWSIAQYRPGPQFDMIYPANHWAPIWLLCPVCSHNFTVFAREETMQADLELFKSLAGLHDKQPFTSKSNSYNVYPSERENIVGKNFWSQVERQNIFRLGKDSAFKYDLEMFGYSIHDYLTDIGIHQ